MMKSTSDNGKAWNTGEFYTEEQQEAVEAYISNFFGNLQAIFHEIVSPDIHVDICIIAPAEGKDYYTLVTMGMGAHRMNVPAELAEHKLERAELVIALPSGWKLDEGDNENWYWPLRLLKQLARLPGECDTWLGCGHTVDNQEPFAENTKLCGSMLALPVDIADNTPVCSLPDGEQVNFYQVIPLYQEEMEFKQATSADALIAQMGLSFVVEPGRENFCEGYDGSSDIFMDSALGHLETLQEKELPVKELAAYNHLAIYLRWCIEKGLMSELFQAQQPDLIKDVQSGTHVLDLREQLRDREDLNHALVRTYFNPEGAAFAAWYYNGDDEDAPYYPADVDDYAKQYFGEARYHAKEFQDEAYLFVPYEESYYQGMKQVIDRRFQEWQQMCRQRAENTVPGPVAEAMMRYLGCPCRYFPPAVDDDEIFTAWHKAAQRGQKEGFVPVLIAAEDDSLWESLIMNSDEDSEGADNFGFNAETVAGYRKKQLAAPLPMIEELIARLLKTRKEGAEDNGLDWDEDILGKIKGGEANNRFIGYWDYDTRATMPLILAEIPVRHPWEIFAYLPFGAWNECPDTPELMAVSKHWFEQHGAVPAVLTHNVLEFSLAAPVKKQQALQLAMEHYACCPDIIDQGSEDATVGKLASTLSRSRCWYFWWD